jgi:hypothetical protein
METKSTAPTEEEKVKTDKEEETKDKEEKQEKTINNKKVFLNTTYKKEKHNTKHKNKTIAKNHRYHIKQTWWNHHIKTQSPKLAHIPHQRKEKTGKNTHELSTKKYKCTQKHHPPQKIRKPQKNTKKIHK